MEAPRIDPLPPPAEPVVVAYATDARSHLRTATTALGSVLITLGALGALITIFGASLVWTNGNAAAHLQSVSRLHLVLDTAFNSLSKIGLILCGSLMIARRHSARPILGITFAVSIIGTISSVLMFRAMGTFSSQAELAGFIVTTVLVLGLYTAAILYLFSQHTRREFDTAARLRGER